jgi:hypothetical protein
MSVAALGVGGTVALGVGVAGTAASAAMSLANRPKAYDPSGNNALAKQNVQDIKNLSNAFQSQISGYGDAFLPKVTDLSNTYGNQGAAWSKSYLKNSNAALSNYGTAISNLAAQAPQKELDAAQAGLTFNQNNLANYGNIANTLSNQDQAQRLAMLTAAMPAYTQGMNQATENAQQQMQGLVPADVQASLGRSSAFNALSSGVGGASGLGRNLTARDLGLTSLQLSQQGTQNFQNLAQNQYNMGVAGLQTTAANVMGNYGVNSGQAMNAAALGTGLAATGLQTGLQGTLSTQGYNYGQMMNLLGNQFNTGVSANQAVMNMEANAASQAYGANVSAITGSTQSQMNGNIAAYQSQNQLAAYDNQMAQQAIGGLTSAASGYLANGGMNYLSGIGNGGLQSNGFYNSAGAAQSAFGDGAHIASYAQPGGGLGYYNQYYS